MNQDIHTTPRLSTDLPDEEVRQMYDELCNEQRTKVTDIAKRHGLTYKQMRHALARCGLPQKARAMARSESKRAAREQADEYGVMWWHIHHTKEGRNDNG